VIIYLFRLRLNRSSAKTFNINASNSFASKSVFIDSKEAADLDTNSYESNFYDDQRRLLNNNDNNSVDFYTSESNRYYNSINAF
jgi:hypothetical protein